VGAVLERAGVTVCPRRERCCVPNVRTGTIAGTA
jgi:hypothetical protein